MQESIVFLVRVQYRRKESSRSLSHLLMSFLFTTPFDRADAESLPSVEYQLPTKAAYTDAESRTRICHSLVKNRNSWIGMAADFSIRTSLVFWFRHSGNLPVGNS